MSGRVGVEQTPDIEAVTSIVLDSLHYADHHGGMSMLSLSRHVAQALAPVLAAAVREARAAELREAAAWIAESIGYPIQATMPDHPMPDRLWEALVDHVHADHSGEWHGNELSRDEVGAWLAEEANRADRIDVDAPKGGATCAHGQREGDCASCAACAACRGECGTCPYVPEGGEGR